MGVIDSLFSGGTSEDGSGGGFMDSPIAMMLMPRVAGALRQQKHENFLMKQYKLKAEAANKFADQIEGTDPQAAAMLRGDPSTMDNIWTAWNANKRAQEQAAQGYKYDLSKQENAATLAQQTDAAKNNLPGGAGDYRKIMNQFLQGTVQPDGVMVNPSVQGPRPDGQLQQGQTVKDINPEMAAAALAQDFKLPGLAQGDAMRILTDPKAAQDLQTSRRNALDAGKSTVDVVIDGKTVKMAMNPDTGKYENVVGDTPKTAEQIAAEARSEIFLKQDGTYERRGYSTATKLYDRPQGEVAGPDLAGKRDHINKVFPDGSVHIMLWDAKKNSFAIDDGISPLATGEVKRDENGNIIGMAKPGKTGTAGDSVDQHKGQALLTGIDSSIDNIATTWSSLGDTRNRIANFGAEAMGNSPTTQAIAGFLRTPEGRQARDSLTQIAQTYVYALSGQQAPDQEVARLTNLVMPNISDDQATIDRKEARLADMVNTVRVKANGGSIDPAEVKKAKMAPDGYKAPDPDENSGLKLNNLKAPGTMVAPMPDFMKGHLTKQQWNSATPEARQQAIDAFKPAEQ